MEKTRRIVQETDNKTPTVFDVADLAGVSRGTVDRVLYGRGRVSQSTREKVLSAISSLNYIPNSHASQLASRKEYLFCCLIPEFSKGEYWEYINTGFVEAAKNFSSYSLKLRIYYYNQNEESSFVENSRKILESSPSGVIMNAVFRDEVTLFAHKLEEKGIPYAFVDNKIDELDYTLYHGVDPYKSGALGAYLLTVRSDVKDVLMVRLKRDPRRKADPNRPRRHGFTDYVEDHFPQCRIHTVFIDPEDSEGTLLVMEDFFKRHPDVHHIAMTNSRVFLLGEYLKKHPDPQRIVVGFDDLDNNLNAVKDGLVNCLVIRHISQQSYASLTSFAEFVILGRTPRHRNNFVHMGILTKMNMDS